MGQVQRNLEFLKRSTSTALHEMRNKWKDTILGVLTMKIESDGSIPHYWLGDVPLMTEHKGSIKFSDLAEMGLTITNKDYSAGIRAFRKDLSKPTAGALYKQRIQGLAEEAAVKFPIRHMWELINSLHSTNCYDGQYFFDTNHKDPGAEYATSQSNDLTATAAVPAAPTLAEFRTAYNAQVSAMAGFKNDKGEYWFQEDEVKQGLVLFVPFNMEQTAIELFESDKLPGPNGGLVTNPHYKRVTRIIASKRLEATASDVFYLFKTDQSVKPIIWQIEKVEGKEYRVEQTGLNSVAAVVDDEILHTIKRTMKMAPGQWRYAVRTDLNVS